MVSFTSDYVAGMHPAILDRLVATNMENLPGYGTDFYCDSAKKKILDFCGCKDGEVYLLEGGTQTNQLVIDTMLAPYEGVVAAATGHVAVHEAGAIEFAGIKVLTIPEHEGKMNAVDLESYIKAFYENPSHDHMVFPGMAYISHPTEYGTLYSKKELEDISSVCRQYEIPLYLDGARLGYGLASEGSDVTINDIANLCDVFYIGGTKVGAMIGEAVVFTKKNAPKHLITQIKQHGALLAKGRMLGIAFDTLFTDDLYMEIGRYALEKAKEVRKIFTDKGYKLFIDSPTNQQFIILPKTKLAEIDGKVAYEIWEPYDEDNTVVRFATSWSTTDSDIEYLRTLI